MHKFLVVIILFVFNIEDHLGQTHLTSYEFSLDTKKNVQLIFNSTVVDFKLGSSDILIKKTADSIVSLSAKAANFNPATLLLQTKDGYFAFSLVYKKNPKYLQNIIPNRHAIFLSENSKNPIPIAQPIIIQPEVDALKENKFVSKAENDSLFIVNSLRVEQMPRDILTVGAIEQKVYFYLNGVYFSGNDLYLSTSIENLSKSTYNIDFFKFIIHDVDQQKSESSYDYKEPIFLLNGDKKIIKPDSKATHIFVFRKFTFERDRELMVEIWESKGKRHMLFEVVRDNVLGAKKIF